VIRALYVCMCDRCGAVSMLDEATAFERIDAAPDAAEPPLVSRCEVVRETEYDDESTTYDVCQGTVRLCGVVPLSPLPTKEQIAQARVTRGTH